MTNDILTQDLEYILQNTSDECERFCDSTILITGCAGFLGFYFMKFFDRYAEKLGIKRIIGLDNFMLRKPKWVESLSDKCEILPFCIINDNIAEVKEAVNADFIIHAASIASPSFYRKYPLETLDANIWGLRKLLEFYKDKNIKGFLFFSSSEIYGDPLKVPTDEEYRGNVACIGARACYDESKRFGETICYIFAQKFSLPITIARPFNNYGAGMNIYDLRVPADFARAIVENKNIEILSDGSPKRTFCYIADAIVGYLKVLVYGKFEYFNIGIDKPEISIKALAEIYQNAGKRLFNYQGEILFATSSDKDYLTHNPQRRCPDITKARNLLSYNPQISVEEGVYRFLSFLKQGE